MSLTRRNRCCWRLAIPRQNRFRRPPRKRRAVLGMRHWLKTVSPKPPHHQPFNFHLPLFPMRFIEPHGHMVSRVTNDYTDLVAAGCQAVTEPAFWAGFDRTSADGFFDYFRQLTEHEPKRAAKFGLPHYCWLCINPKE